MRLHGSGWLRACVWVGYRAAVGGAGGDQWNVVGQAGSCFFFADTRAGRQSRDAAKFAHVVAVIVGADTMVVAAGYLGDKPNISVAGRHWTPRAF